MCTALAAIQGSLAWMRSASGCPTFRHAARISATAVISASVTGTTVASAVAISIRPRRGAPHSAMIAP